MKRIFSFIICLTVICSMAFLSISCEENHSECMEGLVWDGQFLYGCHTKCDGRYDCKWLYHGENTPHYYIAATDEVVDCNSLNGGNQTNFKEFETLYIPAYFNNTEITHFNFVCYERYGRGTYSINVRCEKLYLSFAIRNRDSLVYQTKEMFLINVEQSMIASISRFRNRNLFCWEETMIPYYAFCKSFEKEYIYTKQISNHQAIMTKDEWTTTITAANTAYMFNYEGSPNEDYFFINDFERGGLIEDTPYEPLREGYTFGGWYKDSACTEKWDFSADKLPEATYDEEGNFEYVETRLYAKWIQ